MSVVQNISYLKSVYALKFIDLKAIKATKNSSFSIKTNCLTTINYEKDGKIIRLRFWWIFEVSRRNYRTRDLVT